MGFSIAVPLCVLLSLLVQLPPIYSQYCEPYIHNNHPATLNVCDQFIENNTYVFIPPNSTQSTGDDTIATFARLALFWPLSCSRAFLHLFCRTGFIPCESYHLFPAFPCKSQCREVLDECESYLEQFLAGSYVLDCNQTDPTTGYEIWPETESIFDVFGNPYVVLCSNASSLTEKIDTDATCPYPFQHTQLNTRTDDRAVCEKECPYNLLLPNDFVLRQNLLDVTLSISIFVFVLVFIPYIMLPSRRKFPHRYKLNVLICAGGVTVSLFVSVGGRIDNVSCSDSTTIATQSHGVCAFQGVMLVYFGLGAALWYTITNLNVFGMIYFPLRKSLFIKSEKYVQIAAWTIPMIFVIIGLANNKFGSYTNSTYCLFVDADNWAWHYALFYAPLAVLQFFGVSSLLATLCIIAKHDYQRTRTLNRTSLQSKVSFKRYQHILFFCALGLYIYTIIIAERFNWVVLLPKATDLTTIWLTCIVQQFATMGDQSTCIRPTFGSDTPFEFFFFLTTGLLGFCVSLCCALEQDFIAFVADKLTNFAFIITGRKREKGTGGEEGGEKDVAAPQKDVSSVLLEEPSSGSATSSPDKRYRAPTFANDLSSPR